VGRTSPLTTLATNRNATAIETKLAVMHTIGIGFLESFSAVQSHCQPVAAHVLVSNITKGITIAISLRGRR
jgi:hypothetical protein